MYMIEPIPMAEARRRLSQLVRKIANGHAPIPIGRRGKVEAVLVSPEMATAPAPLKPLRGLLKIVGSPEDLDRGFEEISRLLNESEERTARELDHPPRRHPKTRRS